MGKVKNISGKEHMQRINYLYQASNLMLDKNSLSVFYCNLAINIAKKAVQRLDIPVKRTICKGCRNLLMSGINARVRINNKKLRIVCLRCNTGKKIDLRNYHDPWVQCPEAVVEVIDYNK